MKKYLSKQYLSQIPVIIFCFVLFINLVALVHALIREEWVNVAADVCVIVMLINWFVMWNMYEKASSIASQMIDENWEMAKTNYQLRLAINKILRELNINADKNGNIDLDKVIQRIQELKDAQ